MSLIEQDIQKGAGMEVKKENGCTNSFLTNFKAGFSNWWLLLVKGKGTPREEWATEEELLQNPKIKAYIKRHNEMVSNLKKR